MANTPWLLRETDPQWRDDHDYKPGAQVWGSDGQLYFCTTACGPNNTAGAQDPTSTTGYWESLKASLAAGGSNELDGSISGNAATATKLAPGSAIDGVLFDGSVDITHYGVCSTDPAATAKTVTIANFKLTTGAVVYVYFVNTNTEASPTLNVNDTGDIPIEYNGASYSGLVNGCVYSFVYDGTVWNLAGGGGGGTIAQSGNNIIGDDSSLNLDNLLTAGKYFITTGADSTGTPKDGYARSYWITVSTYTTGADTYVLQEARMHSTSSSNATDGGAQYMARCYTNGTWGPWEYSYTQFAG